MIMKKFINNPENLTAELLEGYCLAYKDKVKLEKEKIVVRVNAKSEDKVAIISMGGTGHEPAVSGFVGEGLLDEHRQRRATPRCANLHHEFTLHRSDCHRTQSMGIGWRQLVRRYGPAPTESAGRHPTRDWQRAA